MIPIKERGEFSIEEIVEILHISRPSASALVARLVEMAMLVREPSEMDRREARVRRSPSGAVRFWEVERQILEYISALLIQLGPACSTLWFDEFARIRDIVAAERVAEVAYFEKKEGVK